MMFLKSLFIFTFIFSLNSFASLANLTAQLSHDAYLSKDDFIAKYKDSVKSIVYLRAKSVNYYTLLTKDDTLIVIFQGSVNVKNWESNFNIGETRFLKNDEAIVHRGFYEEALYARIKLKPYIHTQQKVIVTGHSLGAAVALLFSAILKHDGFDVELFTFASPPVGNKAFTDSIHDLKHLRYTHILDIVPKLKKAYVDQLKSALSALNGHIKDRETIKNFLAQLEGIPYRYVHHGKHYFIHNLQALPAEDNNASFAKKTLLKVLLYHSSQTYLNGVKESNQLVNSFLNKFL